MNMVTIVAILVMFAGFVIYTGLVLICCRAVKRITDRIVEMIEKESE